MRRAKGFSLIELMVTLAIMAILVAIAAPSFTTMLANAQIKTGTQSVNDGLILARVESMRRNSRVMFALGTQTGWTVTNESDNAVVQASPTPEGAKSVSVSMTPINATKVTFDGRGHVVTNTDGTASLTQVDVTVPTSLLSASLAKNLRVNISSGGSIQLCNPNETSGVGNGC